jgi:hypothetical protein
MGTRLSKQQRLARDQRARDAAHSEEAWCVYAAIVTGTWCDAGINREVINGEVAGYWKRLRCGCMLVVEVDR